MMSCDNVDHTYFIHSGISSTILSQFGAILDADVGIPGILVGPVGITYNGTNLISADNSNGFIYIHDGITGTIPSFFETAPGPTGVVYTLRNELVYASEDTALIYVLEVTPTTDNVLYVNKGVKATVVRSFAAPDASPQGLAYDNMTGNLLSIDLGTDLIYIHSGITSTVSSTIISPSSCRGLTYHNNIINMVTGNIFPGGIQVHKGMSQTVIQSLAAPSSAVAGLTTDTDMNATILKFGNLQYN